jgi:hypothetical protein
VYESGRPAITAHAEGRIGIGKRGLPHVSSLAADSSTLADLNEAGRAADAHAYSLTGLDRLATSFGHREGGPL